MSGKDTQNTETKTVTKKRGISFAHATVIGVLGAVMATGGYGIFELLESDNLPQHPFQI